MHLFFSVKVLSYAAALAVGLAAVVLRWVLEPVLSGVMPLVTVFGAVAVAVGLGGYGPAIAAAVFSYAGCAYLFSGTPAMPSLMQPSGVVGLLLYMLICAVIIAVGGKARSARRNLQRSHAAGQAMLDQSLASDARSRTILESISDSFLSLDRNWRFVYVNPAAQRLLGRSEQDLVGKSLWLEYPGAVGSGIEAMYRRVARTQQAETITAFYAEHDTWYEIRAFPAAEGLSVYFRDVTDQKRRDEALQASEQHRKMAFDAAELGAWNITADQVLRSDERFRLMFTGSTADMSYQQAADAVHPDDVARVRAAVAAALNPQDPAPYAEEYRVVHPDGTVRWVMAKGGAKFAGTGSERRLVSFDGTVADVTERNVAEEKLRTSEERFRTLFDSMDEGFCVINMVFDAHQRPIDYRFIEMNPAFERHTGLQNAVGKTMSALAPDLERFWFETYGQVATTGEATRFVHEAKALGRWFDVYAFRIGKPAQRRVATLFKDITARKQAEDKARDADEQLRALADNMPQLAWITEAGGTGEVQWFNKSWLAYTGATPSAMQGDGWQRFIHPEHLDAVVRKFSHHVRHGLDWEDTFQLRARNHRYRWFLCRMNVIRGEGGKVARIFGTGTDITEQREMAEQLLENDRRKDEFLATLAHELRNPLAPIRNSLQILRLKSHDSQVVASATDMMQRQLAQMTRLVDDLLDVSRISGGKVTLRREQVALSDVIHSAVEASQPLLEASGLTLAVRLPHAPIWLNADLTRLAQVFTNLLNNAAKFTDRGGQVTIAADLVAPNSLSDAAAAHEGGALGEPGEPSKLHEGHEGHEGREARLPGVRVSVRDTGIGIADDQRERIFEMFTQVNSSLERSQGGLGLGLTLVRRFVELHHGQVEVRSDGPGQGSTFTISLPVLPASAVTATTKSTKATAATAALPAVATAEADVNADVDAAAGADALANTLASPKPPVALKVLVVDDNQDAANSLAMMLELMDHQAQTVHDGPAALLATAAWQPDLVLLDLGMPGMSGYEVARQIRAQPQGKAVKLYALTGWGQDQDRQRTQAAGFDRHLVKPLDPAVLESLLAELGLCAI